MVLKGHVDLEKGNVMDGIIWWVGHFDVQRDSSDISGEKSERKKKNVHVN